MKMFKKKEYVEVEKVYEIMRSIINEHDEKCMELWYRSEKVPTFEEQDACRRESIKHSTVVDVLRGAMCEIVQLPTVLKF